MKDFRKSAISNLQYTIVWLGACLIAILLVEYNALAGLAFALVAGIVLGILLWR